MVQRGDEDHSEDDDDANGSDLIEIYRYEINIMFWNTWVAANIKQVTG